MIETTRIFTLEITVIGNSKSLFDQTDAKKMLEEYVKRDMGADDCVVTNVQDFEMDVNEDAV